MRFNLGFRDLRDHFEIERQRVKVCADGDTDVAVGDTTVPVRAGRWTTVDIG